MIEEFLDYSGRIDRPSNVQLRSTVPALLRARPLAAPGSMSLSRSSVSRFARHLISNRAVSKGPPLNGL